MGIFPYIGLINLCIYLQFRFLKWPLIKNNAFLKGMNKLPRGVTKLAYQGVGLSQNPNPQISKVYQSSRCSSCMAGCKPYTYRPVNQHRPCQIGVGRRVSNTNRLFSGFMLIEQRVDSWILNLFGIR